mgnify:CR=1 FL=1
MSLEISNKHMRSLWLKSTGLHFSPTHSLNVLQIIKDLGFVQLDTIQNVSRAHHHILWSRNENYREHMLDDLLIKKENIFEHFTHDASVLPVEFYPMWRRQFNRMKQKLDKSKYYTDMLDEKSRNDIKNRIKNEGALSTQSFDTKVLGEKKMWSRPPHKTALDYMWYCGELSTSHRENFRKFYDLSQNVIPENILNSKIEDEKQVNWLCEEALHRLSIGNEKEIKNFWDAADIKEVKLWAQNNKNNLKKVKWETHEGEWIDGFAPLDIEERLNDLKISTSKIKIINPFDPAIRDRNRLKNIFGFEYKIEIFVPESKRKWGYYVYPLLEGNTFIGRIELKANQKKGQLNVINFWEEPNIKWNENRRKKLESELKKFAKYVNLTEVVWP